MSKKEVLTGLIILVSVLLIITISGCWKKTEIIVCETPMTIIDETCCYDLDNDRVCDPEIEVNTTENTENITPGVCGNSICENETENCTNCWKDCGACKQIVYIYTPRNFTLAELQNDLNVLTRDGIKFRKDITALNNVSSFFYFNDDIPRYYADFMGVKFKFLDESRMIVLNHVFHEEYRANDTESLMNYVNFSNWYLTHSIRSKETADYENRISTEAALKDYPSQPTGYQKENRYEDWEFKNYTKKEKVIFNNMTVLDNGMVESLYAGMTDYKIIYKYHEYYDREIGTIEAFKPVDERMLDYTHSLSFICGLNLVITVYNYDYDDTYCTIKEDCILNQIKMNRGTLKTQANRIKSICDRKYAGELMIYT